MCSCLFSFIIFIVAVFFIAGVVGNLIETCQEDYKKMNGSQSHWPSGNSRPTAVKKSGRRKRYRVNKYGEVFEE